MCTREFDFRNGCFAKRKNFQLTLEFLCCAMFFFCFFRCRVRISLFEHYFASFFVLLLLLLLLLKKRRFRSLLQCGGLCVCVYVLAVYIKERTLFAVALYPMFLSVHCTHTHIHTNNAYKLLFERQLKGLDFFFEKKKHLILNLFLKLIRSIVCGEYSNMLMKIIIYE